jgi:hypothetical protein
LILKKGAQVLLLKNIDVKNGLYNGSRGVVVGFQKSVKHVGLMAPIVRFNNGICRLIERERWDIKSGDKVVGSRTQIPLMLAWAITIHRSQGMTIDKAVIALAECFEFGQAYVALSRLRSLEGCRLLSFDPQKIKAHQEVVHFYHRLSQNIAKEEPLLLLTLPEQKKMPHDKLDTKTMHKTTNTKRIAPSPGPVEIPTKGLSAFKRVKIEQQQPAATEQHQHADVFNHLDQFVFK